MSSRAWLETDGTKAFVSLYESYGSEVGLGSALDKLELHQGDGGESQAGIEPCYFCLAVGL